MKTTCPNCKRVYEPELGSRKHPEMLIQNEFPQAKAYQREQLITGICSDKCWDEFLGCGEEVSYEQKNL